MPRRCLSGDCCSAVERFDSSLVAVRNAVSRSEFRRGSAGGRGELEAAQAARVANGRLAGPPFRKIVRTQRLDVT
jgi:hypothetical protein